MAIISLTPRELIRLKKELNHVPDNVQISIEKEITSEYGASVFLYYRDSVLMKIDLTELDNF